LLKKAAIGVLCVAAVLGVTIIVPSYIFFPRWVKSWVDFRPRPPYLPISVPFTVDQAPYTTTAYFVIAEDDERITLQLHYKYEEENYADLSKLLEKNRSRGKKNPETGKWDESPNDDSNIPQRLEIEIWTVRDGREESVFADVITNPSTSGRTTGFIDSRFLTFPFAPKKNEIYRIQVINAFAGPDLAALSKPEIYICQGCGDGK